MLTLPASMRVFVARGATDLRTCKHLRINPFVYLRDVIERVSTHPARLVLELTPREWKRLQRDSGAQAAA